MSSRKQDIIDTAVLLFNERGFYNVSLKEIAREMEISPGNLTYHFPRKEDLLKAIQEQLIADAAIPLMPDQPAGLEHLMKLQQAYHQNQIKYSFYFNNLLYIFRTYPDISESYRRITEERLRNGRRLIAYYVDAGLLKPEPSEHSYDDLVRAIWMTSVFWTGADAVLGPLGQPFRLRSQQDVIWSLLIPFLTRRGQEQLDSLRDQVPSGTTQF